MCLSLVSGLTGNDQSPSFPSLCRKEFQERSTVLRGGSTAKYMHLQIVPTWRGPGANVHSLPRRCNVGSYQATIEVYNAMELMPSFLRPSPKTLRQSLLSLQECSLTVKEGEERADHRQREVSALRQDVQDREKAKFLFHRAVGQSLSHREKRESLMVLMPLVVLLPLMVLLLSSWREPRLKTVACGQKPPPCAEGRCSK